jgi:hypothetical protein
MLGSGSCCFSFCFLPRVFVLFLNIESMHMSRTRAGVFSLPHVPIHSVTHSQEYHVLPRASWLHVPAPTPCAGADF